LKISIRSALTLFVLFLVFGCARTPLPSSYRLTTQQDMESAHHWDVLAEDVAEQIRVEVAGAKAQVFPLHVKPSQDSPFGQGFHNMLLTRLVNKGVRMVAQKIEKTVDVTYDVQVVYHRKKPPAIRPLAAAILAAEVLVVRDVFLYRDATRALAAIAGAVVGNSALEEASPGFFTGREPNTEIIITTSMVHDNAYVLRKTDCYYTNIREAYLYEVASSRKIRVID
jgi:hypothetical protein